MLKRFMNRLNNMIDKGVARFTWYVHSTDVGLDIIFIVTLVILINKLIGE